MKRAFAIASLAMLAALVLGSCASAPGAGGSVPGVEQILPYVHVDGFGTETDTSAWIAWEFEAQSFVRYQIAFTSCTCRQESVNARSLLFLEVAKGGTGGKIVRIRYDYWGDSPVMPDGATRAEVEEGFVPLLVNKKGAQIESIDTIAGATVTTVNLKQITKAVLAYHDRKYPSTGMPEAADVDPDATSAASAAW